MPGHLITFLPTGTYLLYYVNDLYQTFCSFNFFFFCADSGLSSGGGKGDFSRVRTSLGVRIFHRLIYFDTNLFFFFLFFFR